MDDHKQDDIPEKARPFYDKGLAALERNNLDYAMDMFEAALKAEPRLLHTRRLLRNAAIRKTRMNPAGKVSLLKASGQLIKISALIKKDPSLALERAEAILNTDPLNLKFAKIHCDAALACGLPETAIQTLEIIHENGKADFQALQRLAGLYQQAGLFEKEYQCHEKMVELKPGDAAATRKLKDAAARLTMNKSDWKNGASP